MWRTTVGPVAAAWGETVREEETVLYGRRVRWDRFFEDLEDQLDSEWEAERAALDTEAERLRMARLTMHERMTALARGTETPVTVDLLGDLSETGVVAGVGPDWIALDAPSAPHHGAVLIPLSALVSVALPHAEVLRSARGATPGRLQERMTFGFVLRDVVRRRVAVTVVTTGGRAFVGTADRAASDHLDVALHDRDVPRRADLVMGHRIIPFAAIAAVRLDAPIAVV